LMAPLVLSANPFTCSRSMIVSFSLGCLDNACGRGAVPELERGEEKARGGSRGPT
jgi:hypothetical protein